MKIFFAGTGGQGKSTSARLLSDSLNLPVIDGISRSGPHRRGSEEHQKWVAEKIHDSVLNNPDGIFCRSIIDVNSYSDAMGFYVKRNESLQDYWLLGQRTVIFFPLLFAPEDDGVRFTDQRFAEDVHISIKTRLDRSRVDYYTVKNESPEDRNKHILDFLYYQGVI